MNMKDHLLAALREQFERWEQLLTTLSGEQVHTPRFDLSWSIKDVIAHLWAWQQVSIARMEAVWSNREPMFPDWVTQLGEDWENKADPANALIYNANHEKSWSEIYQNWRAGFLRFLEAGDKIAEKDLLDGSKYAWLKGYHLADILVASYDHHQEHFEKLSAALENS